MAKDVEYFLKCLTAIRDLSVESLCLGLYPFFIRLFVLLMSSLLSSLYILEISPLFDVGLVKIFPHYLGCCLSC